MGAYHVIRLEPIKGRTACIFICMHTCKQIMHACIRCMHTAIRNAIATSQLELLLRPSSSICFHERSPRSASATFSLCMQACILCMHAYSACMRACMHACMHA